MTPFAATSMMLFAFPFSPLAQPRHVVGSLLLAALTGSGADRVNANAAKEPFALYHGAGHSHCGCPYAAQHCSPARYGRSGRDAVKRDGRLAFLDVCRAYRLLTGADPCVYCQ